MFSVFVREKVIINGNISFTDYTSGIRLLDCSKLAVNWKNDNDVTIFEHNVIVNFFDVVLIFLSSLVAGPRFMSISSSLVLELWQFPFIKDWPEIRKSKIPSSEFFPMYGDWGKEVIPNLTRTSLIKCYWMLISNIIRRSYCFLSHIFRFLFESIKLIKQVSSRFDQISGCSNVLKYFNIFQKILHSSKFFLLHVNVSYFSTLHQKS